MVRRSAVVVGAVVAFVAGAALSACQPPAESPAGLLVTSGGHVERLDDPGGLDVVAGAPMNARHLAVGGRSVAILTEDGRLVTASAGDPKADNLQWRPVPLTLPASGFTAGIDVSPDGRSVALVRAHDDANRLELVVVDLATGDARNRTIDLGANGPPSWLGNDALALEVVDADGAAKVVSVAVPGGDGDDQAPIESAASGFALATTPNGQTLAVGDEGARSVAVVPRDDWWSGGNTGVRLEPPPGPDVAVQDVAIDADGTRVGAVYAHGDTSTWTLVVSRLVSGAWERAASFDVVSDSPPTIDWLE